MYYYNNKTKKNPIDQVAYKLLTVLEAGKSELPVWYFLCRVSAHFLFTVGCLHSVLTLSRELSWASFVRTLKAS